VTTPRAPPVELIQSLFDLTPAEARIARSLVSGKTVEEIALERSISVNTVRTHVRGVLRRLAAIARPRSSQYCPELSHRIPAVKPDSRVGEARYRHAACLLCRLPVIAPSMRSSDTGNAKLGQQSEFR
jgi:DNA-binding CsgD family transcriptional regulator